MQPHRLPRFFVLWWTLIPPAAIAALAAVAFVSTLVLRNVDSELAISLLTPVALLLWLAAFGSALGVGQALLLTVWRNRRGSAVVMSLVAGAGWLVGLVVGWLLGALVVWGVSSMIHEIPFRSPLVSLTQGLVGGVPFGLLYGLVQAQQFTPPLCLPRWWVAISAAAWAPYGMAVAALMEVTSGRWIGAPPTATVIAALIGVLIPGLVTGLALKHIVESQPGPTEAVPAGVEA